MDTLIQIKCFRTNHTQFKIFSIQMKLFSLDSLLGGGGGGINPFLHLVWPGSSEESGSFYRITLKRLILQHVLKKCIKVFLIVLPVYPDDVLREIFCLINCSKNEKKSKHGIRKFSFKVPGDRWWDHNLLPPRSSRYHTVRNLILWKINKNQPLLSIPSTWNYKVDRQYKLKRQRRCCN